MAARGVQSSLINLPIAGLLEMHSTFYSNWFILRGL